MIPVPCFRFLICETAPQIAPQGRSSYSLLIILYHIYRTGMLGQKRTFRAHLNDDGVIRQDDMRQGGAMPSANRA